MQLIIIILAALCIKGHVTAEVLSYVAIAYALMDLIDRCVNHRKGVNK